MTAAAIIVIGILLSGLASYFGLNALAGLISITMTMSLIFYFRYKKYQKSGRKSDLSEGIISQIYENLLIHFSPNPAITSDMLSSKVKNKKWLLKKYSPIIVLSILGVALTIYFYFIVNKT